MPKYTSITPVLNEGKNIQEMLTSLENQTIPPSEIIIIDGGSDDDTVAKIEEYAANSKLDIKVIQSPIKRNIGAQRNAGINAAKYDWIMNIDAGAEPDKDYTVNMLGPLLKFKNIDLVGGVPHAKKRDAYSFMFCQDEFFVNRIEPYGACALYKKSIAEQIGGYPEYLTYAAEDTVFFYKYQKHSKRWVFNKAAFVLWDIPLGIQRVQSKLRTYFLGGFESGFWPYMYYSYILYPLMYTVLGRWAANYELFKKHYKTDAKQQAIIEVQRRKINGICFVICSEPIYSPRSEKYRDYAYKMIADNYKVFFVSNVSESYRDLLNPPSLLSKVIERIKNLFKEESLAKRSDNKFYLDTDITLLEFIPNKYFSWKDLNERYGEFLDDAKFFIGEDAPKQALKEVKKYCPNAKIIYDPVGEIL